MDRFTFLQEDMDALAEAGLSDEETGLVMLAMARYAMSGQEPDFGGRPGPRIAFAMIRKRLEKYVRKCEANAANGKSGGLANGKRGEDEKEPDESESEANRKRTESESKANQSQEYDYEKEHDEEQEKDVCETVSPEIDTHVQPTARMETRRRARAGWFDPANPDGPDDGAWRGSEEARKAVAQRIVSYGRETLKLWDQTVNTEAGSVGRDLFGAVTEALAVGIPPGKIVRMAQGCMETWVWELRIKEAVIAQDGTLNHPDWVDQLDELREEMAGILSPQLAAYA